MRNKVVNELYKIVTAKLSRIEHGNGVDYNPYGKGMMDAYQELLIILIQNIKLDTVEGATKDQLVMAKYFEFISHCCKEGRYAYATNPYFIGLFAGVADVLDFLQSFGICGSKESIFGE